MNQKTALEFTLIVLYCIGISLVWIGLCDALKIPAYGQVGGFLLVGPIATKLVN